MEIKNEILKEAYNGSYYTITGAGGNLDEWKNGYQDLLNKEEIGTITKWVEFTGKDVNDEFELTGDNRFQDDLHFLAFNLDNLNIGKLAMFKIKMQDRWFDDIIDNTLYFENRGEINE